MTNEAAGRDAPSMRQAAAVLCALVAYDDAMGYPVRMVTGIKDGLAELVRSASLLSSVTVEER